VRKLKVVMVSFAHVHAPGYAEQLAKDQRVDFAGVYDEEEARGKGYAQRYGVPFHPDLASMLEKVKPDLAVVCSPTKMHVEHVKLLAEHRVHVFVEKPLARTVKECDEIIAAAAKAGVKATVGFNARFDPANAAAKAVVERGELGRVLHRARQDRALWRARQVVRRAPLVRRRRDGRRRRLPRPRRARCRPAALAARRG